MNLKDFDAAIDEAMLTLSAPIYNEEAHEKSRDASRIDPACLNDEFIRQAELYHEASSAYEVASYEESKLKANMELAYAVLDPQARATLTDSGVKITEKTIESAIKSHSEYVEIMAAYHAAKKNAGLWKAACGALQQKKDMLVQLGANYRAEGMSDMTLLQEKVRKITK